MCKNNENEQNENEQNQNQKNEYKELPRRTNHKCFGCSPINPSGLQMKFYTDTKTVVSWVKVPEHLCGWENLVHGGVISTMLDEIMSWSAIYLLKRIILTKSITVDFIKPVFISNELKVEGKISEVLNEREAIMEAYLHNHEGVLCAKSKGNFALFTPEAARKLKFLDPKTIQAMVAFINFKV